MGRRAKPLVGLRTQARRLGLLEHTVARKGASGIEAGHHHDTAAEAVHGGDAHSCAGRRALHRGRIYLAAVDVDGRGHGVVVKGRQHLGNCLARLSCGSLGDGTGGERVHGAEQRGDPYGYTAERQYHIAQRRFHAATSFRAGANRRGRSHISMSGVTALPSRMANDIPSGYAPHCRMTTVTAPINTP